MCELRRWCSLCHNACLLSFYLVIFYTMKLKLYNYLQLVWYGVQKHPACDWIVTGVSTCLTMLRSSALCFHCFELWFYIFHHFYSSGIVLLRSRLDHDHPFHRSAVRFGIGTPWSRRNLALLNLDLNWNWHLILNRNWSGYRDLCRALMGCRLDGDWELSLRLDWNGDLCLCLTWTVVGRHCQSDHLRAWRHRHGCEGSDGEGSAHQINACGAARFALKLALR